MLPNSGHQIVMQRAPGDDGAKGATGATGYDGAKGEVGATGYDGAKGDTGAKGTTGDTVIVVPERR